MKIKLHSFAYFLLSAVLMFWSCEDSTSSDNPVPGRVVLVEKSAEDDSVEKGIDAEYVLGSQQNGIFLQWRKVDDNDLRGYRIYRSVVDTSTAFALIQEVKSPLGNIDTFYVDKNAIERTWFYYYVKAVDEDGQEGERSRVDRYKLEKISSLYSPSPSDTVFSGIFQWEFPTVGGFPPDDFVFRLRFEIAPGLYVYQFVEKLNIGNNYQPSQSWDLSELVGITQLQPGRYQWRIDIIGTEPNNGSESEWMGFTVQ